MSDELRSQIVLDLGGNYGQMMRDWSALTARFASAAQYSVGVTGRAWTVLGNQVDRIGGNTWARLAGAGGLALAVRQTADFDEQLTRIGIRADVGADHVEKLKQQIFDMANRPDVRVGVHDIADGVQAIIENGGDLAFAEANMRNLGVAVRATGESGESIGSLIGFLHTLGVTTPEMTMQVIDSWNRMGKASGTSLTDMIDDSKLLLDTYKDMGRTGPQAAMEIGAAFSMVKQSVGDPAKAARSLQIFLQNVHDKWFELQSAGIQIYDPEALKQGRYEMNSLADIIPQILRVTHGDGILFKSLFGDRGELSLSASLEQFRKNMPIDAMQKYLDLQGDGSTTNKDAARAAGEFNASLQALATSFDKFEDRELSGPIKDLANALNSLEPGTVQRWLQVGKYIVEGTLGLYALRKGIGLAKDAWSVGKFIAFGKQGGAGAASALYGGATPVFVTNMGAGMGGSGAWNAGEPDWEGKSGGSALARGASKLEVAANGLLRVSAAGAAGWATGSAVYYGLMQGNKSGDFVGHVEAMMLGAFGDKEAAEAVNRRADVESIIARGRAGILRPAGTPRSDAKIDLRVSFDELGRPKARSASSATHDINLDQELGAGVLSWNPG